jgi:hypothetical protein
VVESAEEISIFFFRVHLPLGRRVVQLEFLHWVPHGCDLFLEEHFEVFALVAFRLAFFDAYFDTGVF